MADGIITPCNVARSWHWFRQVTAHCNVTCGSGITTVTEFTKWQHPAIWWLWDDMPVNSPGGSTLQCGRWLWDDMPWNSPKRPPYWNFTSGFDFDHITAVDMLCCTSLQNFIQTGPPSAEKIDVMLIFKMADLSHLGFYGSNNGSLKISCTTSYRSSIETIALNCLVFEKIAFFLYFGDRQTDGQQRCSKPLSRAAA